jgi:hypothetical protein
MMPAITRRRLLVLLVAAGLHAPPHLSAAGPTEYEVKAAFIYNFAKYVQWPSSAADSTGPVVIAVIGKDPFGSILDDVMSGQTVGRRTIVIRRFQRIDDVAACNILFISSSERPNVQRIFDVLRHAPVLTIGDMDRFAEQGGMINLFAENNRIRFEMNLDAMQRVGLKAGSQLYRLARIVNESPPAR